MGLTVTDLSKKYGNKTVLNNLSFEMNCPGVYALLGTNGAGKTTAIRMILGMLSKNSGTVEWNGKPLSTETCNVGYLAEERGLYPKYSLLDQLIYFASLRGVSKPDAQRRIRYWADKLKVSEYIYTQYATTTPGMKQTAIKRKKSSPKKADQLSKGNQQKVQLICALISDPELIVLDEPLSGLDPINSDLFRSIIHEEIDKGKYIIMSSHQMETVEEFCTDLSLLDHSNTILQGNLNEIKKSYGRVNLHLKTEKYIDDIISTFGITVKDKKENEYFLKISGEEQANKLLGALVAQNITIITFDLREPSLHEIFVDKVGEVSEDEA